MNQRNLKLWALAKNLRVRVDFRPSSEGNFLTGRPYSMLLQIQKEIGPDCTVVDGGRLRNG